MTSYVETLLAGAETIGIEVSGDLAQRMATHHELVVKWGKRINLTTVTEPERAAIVHGLDSLLFAEAIEADGATVDVGSGAGFPGVVIALRSPDLPLTLLEPIRKRASFLRTALATLELPHVRVVEGKLEPHDFDLWPVHRIVSRATIPPLELVALAAPHLNTGGELVLSGGQGAPTEEAMWMAAERHGFVPKPRRRYELPGGDRRLIDVLVRTDVTDG